MSEELLIFSNAKSTVGMGGWGMLIGVLYHCDIKPKTREMNEQWRACLLLFLILLVCFLFFGKVL